MVLGAVAALVLAASQAHGAPPTDEDLKAARETFERAQQVYNASCQERAYGAYDDLCDQLGRQVRQYQLDLDRLERRRPPAKPAPRPGPASSG